LTFLPTYMSRLCSCANFTK